MHGHFSQYMTSVVHSLWEKLTLFYVGIIISIQPIEHGYSGSPVTPPWIICERVKRIYHSKNQESECPVIEELWNLDQTESKIMISHSDVGPYIHVFCPPDHHVVGPTMVTCLKEGVWDDVTLPKCSSSSMFEVPASTMILISIMAGCGALIIITFTFILAHLLYFKRCPIFPARSSKYHNESTETDASMTYHRVNKRYHSISTPEYPIKNGNPMTSSISNHRPQEYNDGITTVTNGNVFVNHVFQPDDHGQHQSTTNDRPPLPPARVDSTSSLQSMQLPDKLQPHENRTVF